MTSSTTLCRIPEEDGASNIPEIVAVSSAQAVGRVDNGEDGLGEVVWVLKGLPSATLVEQMSVQAVGRWDNRDHDLGEAVGYFEGLPSGDGTGGGIAVPSAQAEDATWVLRTL